MTRVLIIDDHPIVVQGWRQLLEDARVTEIYEAICDHKSNQHSLTIAHLGDSGGAFSIYHDQLCTTVLKRKYISNLVLSDLVVEHLSQKDFCQKYIISY